MSLHRFQLGNAPEYRGSRYRSWAKKEYRRWFRRVGKADPENAPTSACYWRWA